MLVRDGERAAAGEHDDQRLAGGLQGLEQVALDPGQADVGAIAAGEAFQLDGHLLAFELRGEAHERDHHVGLLRGCDGLVRRARRREAAR